MDSFLSLRTRTELPRRWAGNIWASTGCASDISDDYDDPVSEGCVTNYCREGTCPDYFGPTGTTTKAEFALQEGGLDFYDVSVIDGYVVDPRRIDKARTMLSVLKRGPKSGETSVGPTAVMIFPDAYRPVILRGFCSKVDMKTKSTTGLCAAVWRQVALRHSLSADSWNK